ncbi:SPOR domain-containing protein [Yoonia sediminilitoris]|uniref:Cell division protein FtsN n=1 Tax=Yoonia sediminilitoris TaxID=1286148 RepID=A0A2T6KRM3_9RHOB|nr:SPOR domain-containing protein [Yoonia sediminilitoris]PUB19211.1 cell division protein FtsN [Yoonia sediminilitoris]RCW99379.1 cell division protein FtsN [Yoonia sediminilitoris]
MAVYEEQFAPSSGDSRRGNYVNYLGAALSLALIAGVGVWGYKLIMRDVSGIPVVRAMEGDMRVLPDNPGGEVAPHRGLAVNEVAAVGEAGGPEDRLVLAPLTAGLAREDLDAQPMAEADEIQPAATEEVAPASFNAESDVVAEATPLSADEIIALADQIANEVEPIAPLTDDAPAIVPASVPGVAVSLRPEIRPASLRVVRPAPAPAPPPTADEVAVSTKVFPAGTDLVQLGAFPNPTLAATQWQRLQSRFGVLLEGRERVIQVSSQSSGTWYRLRASGFADRADAQRLCAALEAEGADCVALKVTE